MSTLEAATKQWLVSAIRDCEGLLCPVMICLSVVTSCLSRE
jgi:hypothetical protein